MFECFFWQISSTFLVGRPAFAPQRRVKSDRVMVRLKPIPCRTWLLSGPPPWTRHVGGLANVFNILRGAPCALSFERLSVQYIGVTFHSVGSSQWNHCEFRFEHLKIH